MTNIRISMKTVQIIVIIVRACSFPIHVDKSYLFAL